MDRGNGNTTPPLPSSHQNTQEQIDTLKSLLARSSSQLQKTKAKLTQSSVNNNQLRDRVENLENEVDLYREAVGNSNSSSSMRTSDLSQQLSQQLSSLTLSMKTFTSPPSPPPPPPHPHPLPPPTSPLPSSNLLFEKISSLKLDLKEVRVKNESLQSEITLLKFSAAKANEECLLAAEIKAEGELMMAAAASLRHSNKNKNNNNDNNIEDLRRENKKLGETVAALREWETKRASVSPSSSTSLSPFPFPPPSPSPSPSPSPLLVYSAHQKVILKAGNELTIKMDSPDDTHIPVGPLEIRWKVHVSPKLCDVNFGILSGNGSTILFRPRLLEGCSDGICELPNDDELVGLVENKPGIKLLISLSNKHSWVKPKVCGVWLAVNRVVENQIR